MRLFKKLGGAQASNAGMACRFAVVFLTTIGCVSISRAQPLHSFNTFPNPHCFEVKKIDNEFSYNGPWEGSFYCNPLMLDGVALDYMTFGLESKGELTLVKGDLKTGARSEIPFRVSLRRNGTLVTLFCVKDSIFYNFDVSTVLSFAQNGDEVIIEPVNQKDWPAKRILKIGDRC